MNAHNGYYLVVWEFQVKLEAQFAFEHIYGRAGDWARLFSQSPNYRGTRLLRDLNEPGRYLTFDYWTSREALHEFKEAHQAGYDAFDKQCESLTDDESLLGEFESLSASSID